MLLEQLDSMRLVKMSTISSYDEKGWVVETEKPLKIPSTSDGRSQSILPHSTRARHRTSKEEHGHTTLYATPHALCLNPSTTCRPDTSRSAKKLDLRISSRALSPPLTSFIVMTFSTRMGTSLCVLQIMLQPSGCLATCRLR